MNGDACLKLEPLELFLVVGDLLVVRGQQLRDDLAKALDRIMELAAETIKLQGENHALLRVINVLELENHELCTCNVRTGRLVALPSANDHRSNGLPTQHSGT